MLPPSYAHCTRWSTLLLHWVTLMSNWGTQFTSSLWNNMAIALGAQLHRTTAYHPQSNGLVERLHQGLRASHRTCLDSLSWTERLPWVLLGLRSMVHHNFNCTVSDLILRHLPLLPGELFPLAASSFPHLSTNSPSHSHYFALLLLLSGLSFSCLPTCRLPSFSTAGTLLGTLLLPLLLKETLRHIHQQHSQLPVHWPSEACLITCWGHCHSLQTPCEASVKFVGGRVIYSATFPYSPYL